MMDTRENVLHNSRDVL